MSAVFGKPAGIQFVQFLLPDGRQRAQFIERPKEIEDLAATIAAQGFRFEIEMLQTGKISMEICTPETDTTDADTLAMEICENGPAVPVAVDKMIRNAISELGSAQERRCLVKAVKKSAGLYSVGARLVARVIPSFRGKRIRGSVPCTWNDVASGKMLGYTLAEAVQQINRDAASLAKSKGGAR